MSEKTIKRLRAELKQVTTLLSYLCECIEAKAAPDEKRYIELMSWYADHKQALKVSTK